MADAGPLLHLPYLFTSLVRLAPINHLLRRLPAANAFIGQVLLLKGYASGCGSGHLLDFLLTLQAAAPHGFYKARLIVDGIHKFIPTGRDRKSVV